MNTQQIKFAFFGSSSLSVVVADALERAGLTPACVVTTPDKPTGRRLAMTPNIVKEWALKRKIRVYMPDYDLKSGPWSKLSDTLKKENCGVFIVASFGKIIPGAIIDLPPRKTLNIHPSLLPKYRGPSPLPTAMLDDSKNTGISIMRMDEQMDHGPIIAQKEITVNEWPVYEAFEEMMAKEGARLLVEILPEWMHGRIAERDQDHSAATYTKKIVKEDGLIDLDDPDQYLNFRKIQAYHEWPQAYFFAERNGNRLRVKLTQASFKDGHLIIEKVIPEGSREMKYDDFLRGLNAR